MTILTLVPHAGGREELQAEHYDDRCSLSSSPERSDLYASGTEKIESGISCTDYNLICRCSPCDCVPHAARLDHGVGPMAPGGLCISPELSSLTLADEPPQPQNIANAVE
jgi:hypothetical protein